MLSLGVQQQLAAAVGCHDTEHFLMTIPEDQELAIA